MSASADLPRRSFLGWTAALGAALLTRPAVAYGFTSYYSDSAPLFIIPPSEGIIKPHGHGWQFTFIGEPRWASQVFFPYDPRMPADEDIEAAIQERR
jgi:hypothetical protein